MLQSKEKSRADEESVSQKKTKGKSKQAGNTQNDASRSNASTTHQVREPYHPFVHTGETVAVNSVPLFKKATRAKVFDSLFIGVDV